MALHDQTPATTPFVADWDAHLSVLIGVVLLAALYLWGLQSGRKRLGAQARVQPWRTLSFFGGLLVMLLALNGPIHDLSDYYLFWVHMGQHLLLTMVVPPLLIAGLPGWMVEPLLRPRGMRVLARLLTHPVVAGVFFSVILLVWHTVGAYDLMMRDHDVHIATHLMFMVAGVMLWWPVMSPAPSLPRLSRGLGMLYLFLVQIPMQLLGAIIAFADHPLYAWYAAAPRTWGLSVLDDQKLGGLLMWIPGNLWIWGAMSVLFFQWARSER
jgi:putative membrane protein